MNKLKNPKAITSLTVLVLVIVGTLYFIYEPKQSVTINPIPPKVLENVLFEAYYPSKLPEGYKIDESSFSIIDGVLIFSISNDEGNKIAFTEQALVEGFDINKFNIALRNPKKIATQPHDSILGLTKDGYSTLSITSSSTWLIANTSSTLTEEDWQIIAKNLKK